MVGIYFSGTGNSRYAVEFFCNEYDETAKSFSIEDNNIVEAVRNEEITVDKKECAELFQWTVLPFLCSSDYPVRNR